MNGRGPFKVRLAYTLFLIIARIDWERMIRLRACLVNIMLNKNHVGLTILPDVYIGDFYGNLTLGDYVALNRGCHLNAAGGLRIGDHVSIGHNCSIVTTNHEYRDQMTTIDRQPILNAPVTLGSNIWLGARACILGGVSIANGTIVAAGAVVSRSIAEPNTIIGGVPARHLKHRFTS
jgi:acetyltransferase-like isoleucine patch superfamily enzyme